MSIKTQLDFSEAKKPPIGFSGDTMYILPHGYQGRDVVYKYAQRKEVDEEGQFYEFLKGKIAVPEVIYRQKEGDEYHLLVTKVEGEMLSETFQRYTKQETLSLYANLLKQFHAIDPTGLPCNHGKNQKLEKVRGIVKRHEAKTQYFERELQGKSPESLLSYLESHQDFEEDLVLCHGDPCFPNFMYKDKTLTGVLDVSGVGINDRHLDIAIALRTLRYNFEMIHDTLTQEDITYFLEVYGLEKLDMNKIIFYIILDDLTNG